MLLLLQKTSKCSYLIDLLWGYQGGDLVVLSIPSRLQSSWNSLDSQFEPWFVCICIGTPQCDTNCSTNTCATVKTLKAPMETNSVGCVMERVAMDIMEPLQLSNRNNRYVLVIQDFRWSISWPTLMTSTAIFLDIFTNTWPVETLSNST
jgi:hypothetical protein